MATLLGHTGMVRGVALSRDGRLLASGGVDGSIGLWDTASGRLRTTLHGHTGQVWCVALSGDGRLVAGGCDDGMVRVWDTASGAGMCALPAIAIISASILQG
jgi:WD40 repeat protein